MEKSVSCCCVCRSWIFSNPVTYVCNKPTYDIYIQYTGKFWWGKKLVNLVNCKLFAKIFLTNIHSYTKNAFCICTNCSLFAKFFLTNSFYLYHSPKFFPAKYFPCMVHPVVGSTHGIPALVIYYFIVIVSLGPKSAYNIRLSSNMNRFRVILTWMSYPVCWLPVCKVNHSY